MRNKDERIAEGRKSDIVDKICIVYDWCGRMVFGVYRSEKVRRVGWSVDTGRESSLELTWGWVMELG